MASLREIRAKIKSTKNTQQITKAMKMVAAARLRRAQARILAARPFAQQLELLMRNVMRSIDNYRHPLLDARKGSKRILLLVTSDKGLCGAFNTNLIREAVRYVRSNGPDNVRLFVIGRKGRDYFRRIEVPVAKEYVNFFNNITFAQADIVTKDILEAYEKQEIGAVDALYNEFKSVIQQKVVVKPLLPMTRELAGLPETETRSADYLFEPSKEELLEGLVLRSLKSQVFRIFLESAASELGARMASMDNASRNAKELIGFFTLQLNRNRQASITKEILEVVSGAEALK